MKWDQYGTHATYSMLHRVRNIFVFGIENKNPPETSDLLEKTYRLIHFYKGFYKFDFSKIT